MAMARHAVRFGAAVFALSMALAQPAVAGADSPDDDTSKSPANVPQASTPQASGSQTSDSRASAGRQARAERRAAADRAPLTPAPAESASANRATANTPFTSTSQRATARRSGAGESAVRPQPSPTGTGSASSVTGRSTGDTAAGLVADTDSTAPAADSAAPVDVSPELVAPQVSAAAPAQLATLSVPAPAATAGSVADLLGGALAPVRAFLEGIVLLVRRTFFNDAPTVAPVQLTGQASGTITGTVGAVDPEGDPITYSVTAAPVFGTVTVAPDGSYGYTPGADFAGTDTFTVAATDSGPHLNLFNPLRPAYTLSNVVVTQALSGPRLRFEFSYAGGAYLWSQEARSALESSATILGSYFVVSTPVTVTYSVTGEWSPLSGTLATATSDIVNSRSGFFPTVVQQKINTGFDANGSTPDGQITWNFGSPWAFGNTVDNSQYDFQSVAMHELLHTFGFLSNVTAPGTNTGTGWTEFDGFLVTADGTALIGSDYVWKSRYDTNINGGNGGVYFGGPAAVAAYGGPVPLFSPSPWQGGSSLSHLRDGSFYGSNEQLMNARVSRGTGLRTLSGVETAILTDLGYTMVPAPGASVMLMFGVFLLRRRREL